MRRLLSTGLFVIGWALFGTALVCPAVSPWQGEIWSGASCFAATLFFPMWSVHPAVMAFAAVNVTIAFSLIVFFAGDGLHRRVFGVFSTACSFMTLFAPRIVEEIWVGCYLWIASAFSISIGLLIADTNEVERSREMNRIE